MTYAIVVIYDCFYAYAADFNIKIKIKITITVPLHFVMTSVSSV